MTKKDVIENIKQEIKKVDDNDLLSPTQIENRGLILNTKLEPSKFSVYALIKQGKLKAIDLGTGGAPKYYVKGEDLKAHLKKYYKI